MSRISRIEAYLGARCRTLSSLILAALLVFAAPGTSADKLLPGSISVGETALPLQASAVRSELWVDVYHCGIYTHAADITTDLADGGAVAVNFTVTTELLPDEPPSEWRASLREVLPKEDYQRLADEFAALEPNHTLQFAYAPSRGTSVSANGEQLFVREGNQLMEAIIELLVGSDPESIDVREQLTAAS